MFPLLILCLSSAVTAYTCYLPDSNPHVNTHITWAACDPSADISPCCSTTDYCLSNGLCMNAGANNLVTIQGCTDPNWGAPCHRYCSSMASLEYSPVRWKTRFP